MWQVTPVLARVKDFYATPAGADATAAVVLQRPGGTAGTRPGLGRAREMREDSVDDRGVGDERGTGGRWRWIKRVARRSTSAVVSWRNFPSAT